MGEAGVVAVILGAAGECGRELYEVAAERGLPVAQWRLYDGFDEIADSAEHEGQLRLIDDADYSGADFVFLCGSPKQSIAELARAMRSSAVEIDVSHVLAGREDAAIMVPEVNADVAEAVIDARLVACPTPGATALAIVLNPIEQAAVLRRVVVACLNSVSTAGREGIEELVRQTSELLAGRDATPSLWPQRIAFNVHSQVGDLVATGGTDEEWAVEQQTRRLLDLPDLPIAVAAVRIPTLFGQGFLVHVETENPIDAEAVRDALREAPGILLHEGAGEGAAAPSLAEAVGSEATHVGRVRTDPTVPYGVSLWVAFDAQRKGSVGNAVQIAESLLRVRA